MKTSNFEQCPPEGDRNLADLRQAILTDVAQQNFSTKIVELAAELQNKLDATVTPVSSEIRRPRK
jgi:hypothetical protein